MKQSLRKRRSRAKEEGEELEKRKGFKGRLHHNKVRVGLSFSNFRFMILKLNLAWLIRIGGIRVYVNQMIKCEN